MYTYSKEEILLHTKQKWCTTKPIILNSKSFHLYIPRRTLTIYGFDTLEWLSKFSSNVFEWHQWIHLRLFLQSPICVNHFLSLLQGSKLSHNLVNWNLDSRQHPPKWHDKSWPLTKIQCYLKTRLSHGLSILYHIHVALWPRHECSQIVCKRQLGTNSVEH